jgi:hypothetical protein
MDTATQALQYLKDDGWLIPDEPEEEDEYADDHQTARSNPYAA